MVWRASHLAVEALAQSDPKRYALVSDLGADLGRLDLGEPVELTASRGDVLFLHHRCVHASSENVGPAPRLALNGKW
jgi:ectoine hydroxylase-related dioxygenase (phytanoyl-CoA dioxygenase family)